MFITKDEGEAISSGVKKFLVIPGEEIYVKEIRQVAEGSFAAVLSVEEGSLDYWLHNKETLQDYAYAHPHELADYLRRVHGNILDDFDTWMRVELVRVPEWDEATPKEIRQALFKLLFRMKTENRL